MQFDALSSWPVESEGLQSSLNTSIVPYGSAVFLDQGIVGFRKI
jgi:hypothetical protein